MGLVSEGSTEVMTNGELPSASTTKTQSPEGVHYSAAHGILIDTVDYGDDVDRESLRSESLAAFMVEKFEKRTFMNAFLTEIGDLSRNISFRELSDVIVCAGKDTSSEELRRIWPFDDGKSEISYDEAFYVFQKIPPIDVSTFESLTESDVDYSRLIAAIRKSAMPPTDKDEIIRLLKHWRSKKRTMKELANEMSELRAELQAVSEEIVQREKADNGALLPINSSTESLSSVFSNTRNSQIPVGDRQVNSQNSSYRDLRAEKICLKSFVIQKSAERMTSIGYTFVVQRPQQIAIGFRINEHIDSDLIRFQNSLIGYVTPENSSVILAMTRKREGNFIRTDWMQFPSGSYTFCIRFTRTIKMMEPQNDALVIDERNLLTKEFKVMLMNTFDMFDLDDDGLLCKEELDTYRILSGNGRMSNEEWQKIQQLYPMRNDSLTIQGFIKMHQIEIAAYTSRQRSDIWLWLRELGYNRRFFLSTACPVCLEIQMGDGNVHVENFEISYYTPESDRRLLEYYWENSTSVPYMKELAECLRIFKADHFAVIVAGNVFERTRFHLDLSSSNNVNIDGDNLIIDVTVEPSEIKLLCVAIAQAENWFLCVKKLFVGSLVPPSPLPLPPLPTENPPE